MNEDMKTLTEKIEKMFQEHGYTTQMKRDTTDPHSRWADIFDELWVWKDEDVYYLQFGRIDGSCIFLGGFAIAVFYICIGNSIWTIKTIYTRRHTHAACHNRIAVGIPNRIDGKHFDRILERKR